MSIDIEKIIAKLAQSSELIKKLTSLFRNFENILNDEYQIIKKGDLVSSSSVVETKKILGADIIETSQDLKSIYIHITSLIRGDDKVPQNISLSDFYHEISGLIREKGITDYQWKSFQHALTKFKDYHKKFMDKKENTLPKIEQNAYLTRMCLRTHQNNLRAIQLALEESSALYNASGHSHMPSDCSVWNVKA